MATLEQYMRERHVPVVVYQGQGAAQSERLPDWLNARYLDINDATLQYQLHIVSETDLGQPDGIAYRYYGNSNWWWLICSYNGVINPLTDMFLGQRLRIPALQQSQLLLQELDGNREDRIGTTAIL